jgi:hypothetical protein
VSRLCLRVGQVAPAPGTRGLTDDAAVAEEMAMRLQGKMAPITGGNKVSGLQRRVGSPPKESSVPADYSFSK